MNSDSKKILLIALAVVLALCGLCGVVTLAGGAIFARTVAQTGALEVEAVAQAGERGFEDAVAAGRDIVGFDLPARFSEGGESFTVGLAGFEMVGFTSADENSHLFLMRAPGWMNLDQSSLDQMLTNIGEEQGRGDMHVTGLMEVDVKGTPTPFVVSEGVNNEGRAYRVITGSFEGNSGTVLLSYVAPLDSWDPSEVEALLASIR
jgi:hypothetical protein